MRGLLTRATPELKSRDVIMAWAWMLSSQYAPGHARYHGLGMNALVTVRMILSSTQDSTHSNPSLFLLGRHQFESPLTGSDQGFY